MFCTVIVNVDSWFATVPTTKKMFFDLVNIKLISQLMKEISSGLQKSLKY